MKLTDLVERSIVRACSIDAQVTRTTGYREDLGRVALWDRSVLKRMYWWLSRARDGSLYIATDPLAGLITALPLAILQVNSGRAIVTGRLLGASQAVPQFASWGTNTGTTAATDTTLFSETYSTTNNGTGNQRATGTMSQVTTATSNDTEQIVATLTAAQAQNGTQGQLGGPISNAGLFDAVGTSANLTTAPSGGNLYMKGDFAIINLNQNDSISFTFKVQYS